MRAGAPGIDRNRVVGQVGKAYYIALVAGGLATLLYSRPRTWCSLEPRHVRAIRRPVPGQTVDMSHAPVLSGLPAATTFYGSVYLPPGFFWLIQHTCVLFFCNTRFFDLKIFVCCMKEKHPNLKLQHSSYETHKFEERNFCVLSEIVAHIYSFTIKLTMHMTN